MTRVLGERRLSRPRSHPGLRRVVALLHFPPVPLFLRPEKDAHRAAAEGLPRSLPQLAAGAFDECNRLSIRRVTAENRDGAARGRKLLRRRGK